MYQCSCFGVEHARTFVFAATCGGTYSGNAGSLLTPDFPNPYANNLDCEWFIRAPTGHFLTFNFPVFSTESAHDCKQADYVEIRDYNPAGKTSGCYNYP